MHFRRIAAFLLGAWLAGTLLMLWVSNQNQESAAALVRAPGPETTKMILTLGQEQVRMLTSFVANEANRAYAVVWEWFQVFLGLVAVCVLLMERKNRVEAAGCIAMVILVLFEALFVSPELAYLGRGVDFVPWRAFNAARDQYWSLNAVFLGMETLKIILGLGVVASLFVVRSRRRTRRHDAEVEFVKPLAPTPEKAQSAEAPSR
jgi:hypothetical protein